MIEGVFLDYWGAASLSTHKVSQLLTIAWGKAIIFSWCMSSGEVLPPTQSENAEGSNYPLLMSLSWQYDEDYRRQELLQLVPFYAHAATTSSGNLMTGCCSSQLLVVPFMCCQLCEQKWRAFICVFNNPLTVASISVYTFISNCPYPCHYMWLPLEEVWWFDNKQ